MNRRLFLARSGWLVTGASGLLVPAGVLWGAGSNRVQVRPELSEETLGTILTSARSGGAPAVSAVVSEVRRDVPAFFRNRFALTPVQEQFISRFTSGEVSGIITSFERGLAGANELLIQLPPPRIPRGKGCRMSIEKFDKRSASGAPIESWVIKVVTP